MYQYQLDKSSKKYVCPNCTKRRFVLYLDMKTERPIADYVGRCDRQDSCQYHYPPRRYFKKHPIPKPQSFFVKASPSPKDLSFLSERLLQDSMRNYGVNPFVLWLESLFEKELVKELIERFYIGTSRRYGGSTVFWQVDYDLKIRQAKIMHYDKQTGKRNKQTGAFFAGKSLLKRKGIESPNLEQCLFGLHQLNKDAKKSVAIVESEKTAILMHAFSKLDFAPDYIWLATGGKTGCKWKEAETWKQLEGRNVILYPDLGAYADWKALAAYIPTNTHISDLLYMSATEKQRKAGFDVADFFLQGFVKNR